jgi:soluble lytic murein transglycosylase
LKSVQVRRLVFSLLIVLVSVKAGFSVQATRKKSTSAQSSSAKSKKAAAAAQKNALVKRKLGHIKRAFVASADLRPMAQQLLENRTPQAYQGVEAYARKHAKDDAGPLAWVVIGYAHYLDKDYVGARSSWGRAKSLEPLLGDYLAYLQAVTLQGENNHAAVLETVSTRSIRIRCSRTMPPCCMPLR